MPPRSYAAQTTVSSAKSRAEIEDILDRYGASSFAYGSEPGRAVIAFVKDGRKVQFTIPLPDKEDPEFKLTPSKKWERSPEEQQKAYEQAVRQKWRALALMVKAKLEGVESGIVSFEQEFLAHIMLPGGKTVYESTAGGIEQAYLTGKSSNLLALTS